MQRDELGDLAAFLAVAEARSFTRAAAKLGTSQSALSHTIKRLESRLGLRLLTRTTRSVASTEAGERLIETLRPALNDIDERLAALSALSRLLVYTSTCLAVPILRRRMTSTPARFVLPGGDLIPALALAACGGLLTGSSTRQVVLVGAALLGGALLYGALRRRKRKPA